MLRQPIRLGPLELVAIVLIVIVINQFEMIFAVDFPIVLRQLPDNHVSVSVWIFLVFEIGVPCIAVEPRLPSILTRDQHPIGGHNPRHLTCEWVKVVIQRNPSPTCTRTS